MGNEDKSSSVLKEVFEWVKVVLAALIIAIIIRAFLFEPVEVRMNSMQDTLLEGQRLIAYKLGYFISTPKKGDIIVFEYQEGVLKSFWKYIIPFPNPQEVDYIKRVIGLPGDVVDIKEGYVYVNGVILSEPYAKGITDKRGTGYPVEVPENKLFVLGDNREVSSDSRQIGFIDIKKVKGKAVLRIYPFKDFGYIYK